MFERLMAFFGLIVMFSLVVGWFFIRRKIPVWAAAVSLVIIYTAAVIVLIYPDTRAYLNIPENTPEEIVEYYCLALNEREYDKAHYKIRGDKLFAPEQCENELAETMRQDFMNYVKIEPLGEAMEDSEGAEQYVRLSWREPFTLSDEICEATVSGMEEAGAARARSLVYNSDKSYKQEIRDEFFYPAFQSVLGRMNEAPEHTKDIKLSLTCRNGKWKIESEKEIYDAVTAAADFSGEGSIAAAMDNYFAHMYEIAGSNAQYIQKHYTIDFSAPVAPAPDESRFGTTTDPLEVQRIVDRAADLLEGQRLAWNKDIEIVPGSEIRYYFDDTILAIVWREERNNTCCTFAEIKIQDASQLRRKLVNDSFYPPTDDWKGATELSADVNAVVATGGDLFAFRNHGLLSYDGVLFRDEVGSVDSCHITRSGDMLFTYRGEFYYWDDAQQWITDNDIMFSMAFGPVLIENGEVNYVYEYDIGEIGDEYARSAMGQLGQLHYLMCVMNLDDSLPGTWRNCTLAEIRDVMTEKGCEQAYALDGGQTAIVIIDDEKVTQVTPHGWERIYSDILYFATALTEEERLG